MRHTRVFTLGVGKAVNRFFVRKAAVLGGGMHEFISEGDKRLVDKVKAQLKRSIQPALSSIDVDWRIDDHTFEVKQSPAQIPSLFSG